MKRFIFYGIFLFLFIIFTIMNSYADNTATVNQSIFDYEQVNLRYNLTSEYYNNNERPLSSQDITEENAFRGSSDLKLKSPAKAFFLSLAVPGLGQYYYGSKIKPVLFLGAEISSWMFYFKWHNEGNDITDEFEIFNRTHWAQSDYETYLMWNYGYSDDDSITATEISHHLPDTRTQQYYEMTGKYDQFAWGWDDAELNGNQLNYYDISNPPPRILSDTSTTPVSQNRLFYERRRDDANKKFDQATKMIFLSIANRLISSFEAMFTTKSINKSISSNKIKFSSIKFRAKLKSYYTKRDTPYITVKYKF